MDFRKKLGPFNPEQPPFFWIWTSKGFHWILGLKEANFLFLEFWEEFIWPLEIPNLEFKVGLRKVLLTGKTTQEH